MLEPGACPRVGPLHGVESTRAASAPRRIAIGLESSGPGGAEQMVLHLASGLRERGLEPVVVTMRPGWMTERAERAGLPVWVVPQRAGLDPAWVPRFARRLRRARIELLHSHEFAMNVYGGMAAALARIPHVATLHGRAWVADRPRRALAYRALRRAGMQLVAVSNDLADHLAPRLRIPRDAFEVVYNGIPLPLRRNSEERRAARARARAELGLPLDARVLVAVGNLYPVKDHASLLRAAARLPASVHVAIAGRGAEEPNLRRLAAELGLPDRLHLLGLRDDVETVLAAGDVFVQPSLSEGLPLAVLEAMAAGLPVVASRVGGLPEAVREGDTGRLAPPGHPDALARALREVLESEDAGAALGDRARRRVEHAHSVDAMLDHHQSVYDRVCGVSRGAGAAALHRALR